MFDTYPWILQNSYHDSLLLSHIFSYRRVQRLGSYNYLIKSSYLSGSALKDISEYSTSKQNHQSSRLFYSSVIWE